MTNKEFFLAIARGGERVSAPVTQVVVQERVSRGVIIPRGIIANDGRGAYLAPGHYASIKDAVRAIRFTDQTVVSYGRDDRNWFCVIVRRSCGTMLYYGLDLASGYIVCRGAAVRRQVQVVQQVTVRRTRWL